MTVVDRKVLAVVENDLQLGRRVVRLENLGGYFIERVIVDPVNGVVQGRVGVADTMWSYVDLFDAVRVIFVATV